MLMIIASSKQHWPSSFETRILVWIQIYWTTSYKTLLSMCLRTRTIKLCLGRFFLTLLRVKWPVGESQMETSRDHLPTRFPAHGSVFITLPLRPSFLVPCCCHLFIYYLFIYGLGIIVPLTEDNMIFRKVKQFSQVTQLATDQGT